MKNKDHALSAAPMGCEQAICGVCLATVYLPNHRQAWWHYASDIYDYAYTLEANRTTCVGFLTYTGETKFAWPSWL